MKERPTPEQTTASMEDLALVIVQMGKMAADIAYIRRRYYEHYLLEGFTEPQALELCKTLTLS